MLCDCPGLVFPSFTNSKAEMLCCGVLPIDQMRDYLSPVNLVVQRIPKIVLEKTYKLKLPSADSIHYTAATFLTVYAGSKGLVTAQSSNPNLSIAARVVLKDYVNGKLCFCNLRPDHQEEKHGKAPEQVPNMHKYVNPVIEEEEEEEEVQEESKGEATEEVSSKVNAVPVMSKKQETRAREDLTKMDKEFFKESTKEVKLTKPQKRALKFAERRGEDISQITPAEMVQEKPKHKKIIGDPKKKKDGNNSNKFYAFIE